MDLLDERTVLAYLADRGVLNGRPATATTLTGGVSNVVLLVETPERRVVLKQALPRLRVADEWYADPARTEAEAAALRVTNELTPGRVPGVIDSDPERHTLTIEAAPPGWTTWKDELMAGVTRPEVGRWLGEVLARWHTATVDAALPPELDGLEAFEQLRLRPYFDVAAGRRPHLAQPLTHYRAALRERRLCLVSGDFSPKNVLVGPDDGWAIDLEVAHRGDPAFDVAFLLHHLALKTVHLPTHRAGIQAGAEAFLHGYGTAPGVDDPGHLAGLVGCLMLARVVGASPAGYLTDAEAARVESIATRVITEPPASGPEAIWDSL